MCLRSRLGQMLQIAEGETIQAVLRVHPSYMLGICNHVAPLGQLGDGE